MEFSGYESIAFSYTGEAVIYLNDGREISVPGHVAEKLLRQRAEEGLRQIPVTRATSPAPVVDQCEIAVPGTLMTRQWKVTISCQVDEVTDDPSFAGLFEVALTSDPKVHMIQFGVSSLPHWVSAVLLVAAAESTTAEAIGLSILKRNLDVGAQAIIGDKPYGTAFQVGVEQFPSSPR
jgi:hypothetical protein